MTESDAERLARHAAAPRLLRAYQDARDRAAAAGAILAVRSRRPWEPRGRAGGRVHGLRRVVAFALEDHLRRRVTALRRSLSADAVAGVPADPRLVAACDDLLGSVPPLPYRRLVFGLVLAIAGAALAVIELLERIRPVRRALEEVLDEGGDAVGDLAVRVLTLDITQVPDALGQFGHKSVGEIAFVVLLLILAAYVVLRPAVSSFRVKRALLCASGGAADPEHDPEEASGAYRLEQRVFWRAPREQPFDLLVLALPALPPLYVGMYMILDGVWKGMVASVVAGALVAGLALVRLRYLARVWSRRRLSARVPDAEPVRLSDSPERPVPGPVVAP